MTGSLFLNESGIREIVTALAERIRADYSGKTLIAVGVLKGSLSFLPDLIRELRMDVEIDFVRLSGHALLKDLSRSITGKHVLLVTDILDTGRSIAFLRDHLLRSHPASLEIVTFLDRAHRRTPGVEVRYAGREVDDRHFFGYGLDLDEKFRNLPALRAVERDG
jgi:hypoxanthine phosphoribosyltransferase